MPSTTQIAEAQRITQQMIEALPNPIFFLDIAGRFIGVNKAWEDFFGISRSECVGKSVHDLNLCNQDLPAKPDETNQWLREKSGTHVYETIITTSDGQRHDTICYTATYNHADGNIDHLAAPSLYEGALRREYPDGTAGYEGIYVIRPVETP